MPADPTSKDKRSEWIPMCIKVTINEGRDPKQAAAICFSRWREHEKKKRNTTRGEEIVEAALKELDEQKM